MFVVDIVAPKHQINQGHQNAPNDKEKQRPTHTKEKKVILFIAKLQIIN